MGNLGPATQENQISESSDTKPADDSAGFVFGAPSETACETSPDLPLAGPGCTEVDGPVP